MKPKDKKREEAESRNLKRSMRTDAEQVEQLRKRRGHSEREIRRLMQPADKPAFLRKIMEG